MKTIVSYFHTHLKLILTAGVSVMIFVIIMMLYSYPVVSILYGLSICAFFLTPVILINYSNYRKRMEDLRTLSQSVLFSLESMPESQNREIELYQDIIYYMINQHKEELQKIVLRNEEVLTYMTLWTHQIKTPIAATKLLLQLEENEANPAILTEIFRIEQYVDMILQYIRLDDMSEDMRLEKYALDDIIKEAVRKFSWLFIKKKLKLNYSDLNYMVLTDKKWLRFVIEQILSNSLKYTKEGSISIYMDETAAKTLVIEDTGIGISESDLPRVFSKGFTGYNGRSDNHSTGIGLYLSKRIIKKLSHDIKITSVVDQGTKVFIDLDTIELNTKD